MTPVEIVEFVALGLGVGTYGTIVGTGGGFLIVPVLLILFRVDPAQAAGTSLVAVFFNSLSGSVSYARQGRIDFRPALAFSAATIPGAWFGARASVLLGGAGFRVAFAVLLLAIAVFLLWKPTSGRTASLEPSERTSRSRWRVHRDFTDRYGHSFRYEYNLLAGVLASVAVGVLSSVFGIGGGIIHVPMMIHLLGFPAHIATATSQFVIVISALVGSASHLALGNVLVGPALALAAGVVVGAQIGAALAPRIRGPVVVRALSGALVFAAVRLMMM
jgi:uncharacterized membrane protein YfcA